MERATTLAEATAFWGLPNTCGFNHAVGSAVDASFVAIETDAGHSAYFGAMDPREVAGEGGDPRPDAVFRTNHGFDPSTVAHYQWNGTHADEDSRERYALFPHVRRRGARTTARWTPSRPPPCSAKARHRLCGGEAPRRRFECHLRGLRPRRRRGHAVCRGGRNRRDPTPACAPYVKMEMSEWW